MRYEKLVRRTIASNKDKKEIGEIAAEELTTAETIESSRKFEIKINKAGTTKKG